MIPDDTIIFNLDAGICSLSVQYVSMPGTKSGDKNTRA